ncbi:LysR family transcriptional regulator [Sulfitobacter porphyrae]|uniref:LysR family transcriptional regulator n=1 Tax=Sulfitobacter porphyrae TaxID=1246864 RepID=A0ABW2B9M5_9RHOB
MINSRHINLNLLELLLQLHDTQSVSAAGSNMGLSQPATSNALARLRQMLEDPLFVRGGRGMEPTPLPNASCRKFASISRASPLS